MIRLSRSPLFAQVLVVVVVTAVLAQLATLVVASILPGGQEPFTLDDAAGAIEARSSFERNGFTLEVTDADQPPAEWEEDDDRERRIRVTLAALLDLSPQDVRVEDQIPIPGGQWLVRFARRSATQPIDNVAPLDAGGQVRVEDMAMAARASDGRWIVVRPIDAWPGGGSLILLWLALNALLLVPLAWIFARRIAAPIGRFAEVADRAGKGDASVTFAGSGPREIWAAANALDQMQATIRQSLDERTKLLAAIAHDLRTPLTRIRFRAEHADPIHRDKMVADIERMVSMIDGVLAYAKGEAFNDRHRLDFTALVRSVIDDASDAGANALTGPAPAYLVDGDALALRRMVSNLVDNAIKYAGSVRCSLTRRDRRVLLLIEDDGPGIDAVAFARLMRPFERGEASRDPATGGVGLGLSIARAIARAHGGDLHRSEHHEQGLSLWIDLPLAEATRDASA